MKIEKPVLGRPFLGPAKIRGQFCENIRTKWTGFICRRTGFIRLRTGFIGRADEASLSTHEASPIVPKFFLLIFLFSQMFSFCLQQVFYHQNQLQKQLFLRTYVDLLNYPFNQALAMRLQNRQHSLLPSSIVSNLYQINVVLKKEN